MDDKKFGMKIINLILLIVKYLEIFIALAIIAAVLVNSLAIFPLLKELTNTDATLSYNIFQKFLSFVLLLIIGLELALMLIRHTSTSVLLVMIYAVARKMLIYNSTSIEMLLGVVTLAVLFFIKKYLSKKDNKEDNEEIEIAQI